MTIDPALLASVKIRKEDLGWRLERARLFAGLDRTQVASELLDPIIPSFRSWAAGAISRRLEELESFGYYSADQEPDLARELLQGFAELYNVSLFWLATGKSEWADADLDSELQGLSMALSDGQRQEIVNRLRMTVRPSPAYYPEGEGD